MPVTTSTILEESKNDISLIIFTCEGREHLLQRTYESFKEKCKTPLKKIILAIDGQINASIISQINPNIIVQTVERKGYVNNILNGLANIHTPYFFWLEDDWLFTEEFTLKEELQFLNIYETVAQIIFSKDDFNESYTKKIGHYFIKNEFSANPCLCKTKPIKQAFEQLLSAPKNEHTKTVGFENFVTTYLMATFQQSVVKFNALKAATFHNGYIESTSRVYHMINSLDENKTAINKEYISGFGFERKINLGNKLGMLLKISLVYFHLIFGIIFSRKIYDFTLRIFLSYRSMFK